MTDCIDHGKKGNRFGYSTKSVGGRRKGGGVVTSLHRWVYAVKVGVDVRELPIDLVVRHTCDNGRCINPEHLIPGTQQDNIRDCVSRKRHAMGSVNGHALLTEADIPDILRSSKTNNELADHYGVASRTIRDVRNRITWSHVNESTGT